LYCYLGRPSASKNLRFRKSPHYLVESSMCVSHTSVEQDDEPLFFF
jgi:hypothetical protein